MTTVCAMSWNKLLKATPIEINFKKKKALLILKDYTFLSEHIRKLLSKVPVNS